MDIVDATGMERVANHLSDRTRTVLAVCANDHHCKTLFDGVFARVHETFDFLRAAVVQKFLDPLQTRGLREAINLAIWIREVSDIQNYRIVGRIRATHVLSLRRGSSGGLNHHGHCSRALSFFSNFFSMFAVNKSAQSRGVLAAQYKGEHGLRLATRGITVIPNAITAEQASQLRQMFNDELARLGYAWRFDEGGGSAANTWAKNGPLHYKGLEICLLGMSLPANVSRIEPFIQIVFFKCKEEIMIWFGLVTLATTFKWLCIQVDQVIHDKLKEVNHSSYELQSIGKKIIRIASSIDEKNFK